MADFYGNAQAETIIDRRYNHIHEPHKRQRHRVY